MIVFLQYMLHDGGLLMLNGMNERSSSESFDKGFLRHNPMMMDEDASSNFLLKDLLETYKIQNDEEIEFSEQWVNNNSDNLSVIGMFITILDDIFSYT